MNGRINIVSRISFYRDVLGNENKFCYTYNIYNTSSEKIYHRSQRKQLQVLS